VTWGHAKGLRCTRCGAAAPLAPAFEGCRVCAGTGERGALEVAYADAAFRPGLLDAWATRPGGVWRFRELLPLPPSAEPITLEEGATPLLRLEGVGPARVWLKDETRNPTGAFKDRFHTVSLSVARALGFRKVTASTTGNHGTSMAAYAARGGLACLAFCDPRAPALQRRLMQAFGARVAVLPARRDHLAWLVRERGWYPSTNLTPMPVATPFGVEGYKTIAYEVYFQLGRRFPSRLLAPTAIGDVLYGPWKGFRELARLGAGGRPPRMVAVQAAGCDPIVRAFEAGASVVPMHPAPRTIALSIGDETAGAITLATLRESGGEAVAVTDDAIVAAMRTLARQGVVVEPSSAAPVAAALAMAAEGRLAPDEEVVCILTGAGVKWPDEVARIAEPAELAEHDPEAFRGWIAAFDRDGRA
jgi:threonine synthase